MIITTRRMIQYKSTYLIDMLVSLIMMVVIDHHRAFTASSHYVTIG